MRTKLDSLTNFENLISTFRTWKDQIEKEKILKKKKKKLQTCQINRTIYFENLFIRLHILYVLHTHVKFRVNQMLFNIRSVNVFFIHNFRSQKFEI